jgi:hypothetical protein
MKTLILAVIATILYPFLFTPIPGWPVFATLILLLLVNRAFSQAAKTLPFTDDNILRVLALKGPLRGMAIVDALGGGGWESGSLYARMMRMEMRGLITREWRKGEEGKRDYVVYDLGPVALKAKELGYHPFDGYRLELKS